MEVVSLGFENHGLRSHAVLNAAIANSSVDSLPRSAVDCGTRAVIVQNRGRFLTLGSDQGKDTPDEPCGNRPARARKKAHAEPDADQLEVNGRRHGGFSRHDMNR
jgi:hypothetical protein